MTAIHDGLQEAPTRNSARRFIGPVIVLGLLAAGYALGLHRYFSLDALAENRAMLREFTQSHYLVSLLALMAVYVVAVAVSFPGASILTIVSGVLFGGLVGGVAAISAATLGAVIIFQIARSSFGDVLSRKAGPALARVNAGFSEDAFSYLLFLRLVPVFPFWLVNIAPAFANVRLRTFAVTTLLGIIPGSFAYAYLGGGLDAAIAAQQSEHAACVAQKLAQPCAAVNYGSLLLTPQLLVAFAGLSLVALIPVVIKKLKARHV